MKKKYRYSFTKKNEAEGGVASVIFASCSLVTFFAASGISFFWEGKAAQWIGALGVMAILFSVCGFFTGLKSFQEKDKSYVFSAIGAIANGVLSIGWLALFLIGL